MKSRADLAESYSWEVEVRLVQAGSELAREHDVTKGPPLSYLHTSRPSTIFDCFVFFSPVELCKMFVQAWDAKVVAMRRRWQP